MNIALFGTLFKVSLSKLIQNVEGAKYDNVHLATLITILDPSK